MSPRFYVYPLIFLTILGMAQLVRTDWRWYFGHIVQLFLVFALSLVACFPAREMFAVAAWSAATVFIFAPALMARQAQSALRAGRFRRAARFHFAAALLWWGLWGRFHFELGRALRERPPNLHALDAEHLPRPARGQWLVTQMSVRFLARDWSGVAETHERIRDWGTLAAATSANLMAARAFAELGNFTRAVRCLYWATVSPASLRFRADFFAAKVAVFALAGDGERLERTISAEEKGILRKFPRPFAAYWRGRCALARGNAQEARKFFVRALTLTHPRHAIWRERIQGLLQEAGAAPANSANAVGATAYEFRARAIDHAQQQTARWRALMMIATPEAATVAVLGALAALFCVIDWFVSAETRDEIFQFFANSADAVWSRQYWRLLTGMLLHGNALHLVMNGAGLWIFGGPVERVFGKTRFVVIFFSAGLLGNLLSALGGEYDLAVGASGGIFGLLGAFAVALWRARMPMFEGLKRRALGLLVLVVGLDLAVGYFEPNVDNLAHAGGFFAGLVIAAALSPPKRA
jgi:membrane associated rhomboid family serine protease